MCELPITPIQQQGWTKSWTIDFAIPAKARESCAYLVALKLWEQEVGGSNPLAPTMLRFSSYAWQAVRLSGYAWQLVLRRSLKNVGCRVEAKGEGGPQIR